ncbi:MFS transporter [Vibrio spartinae]|uniref:Symporter YjmB n=1 Tax=Vibrio spartinae TaxID=1918945 RepID=A0ABX6QX73_9VIBR|nr:glycoside-pentoside-hexuronide (GPH):cation symporter [Vibrio spartinae]QMV13794.1 putative symporter YjmB [Vibrio spartinae]
MNSNDRLASKKSVIFYGAGDFASQLVWTYIGAYLTVFYTDIVGLTPSIIAAIMLGARIWDAFNDPVMGNIAENTRTKFGRFRPYIAFGSPLLAVFSVLTFTNPFADNSTIQIIWATVTYAVTGMLYTLVNIPYAALSGVMTTNTYQRNQINSSRNIGMNLGMIFVNALSIPIAIFFSGEGATATTQDGYAMTALLYSTLSVPLFLLVFFTAKEKIQPKNEHKNNSVKVTFNNLVSNKYLMIVTAIMLIQMTAFMGRISVSIYYVIYCLGSYSLIAVFFTIPSIGAVIGSIFVPFLAEKYGKRNVLMCSMLVQALGLIIIYLSPFNNLTYVFIGCVIFGLFNVGFPMTLSMVADSVDYMESKTGIRTDGTAYATYGLATKMGSAIGGSVGILIIGSFGYVANQNQTMEAINGINLVVNLIPALLFVLASAFCLMWDIDDVDVKGFKKDTRNNKIDTLINSTKL